MGRDGKVNKRSYKHNIGDGGGRAPKKTRRKLSKKKKKSKLKKLSKYKSKSHTLKSKR